MSHVESPIKSTKTGGVLASAPSDAETTGSEQREISRWHRNLGHPARSDFARALAHARCKPHLVRWARVQLTRPTCVASMRSLARRPAKLATSLPFNHGVGVDIVDYRFLVIAWCLLNTVCWEQKNSRSLTCRGHRRQKYH